MTASVLAWILVALLLFWSVGAYNRLVRLRAEVNAAFAALDAPLQQQARLAAAVVEDPADEQAPVVRPIEAASTQLMLSLAAARAKPLAGEDIVALRSAWLVLAEAWERAAREDAHDLAGPQIPEGVLHTYQTLGQQAEVAAFGFNGAVERYNTAIAQFPASLLARLFGFKAGGTL